MRWHLERISLGYWLLPDETSSSLATHTLHGGGRGVGGAAGLAVM